MSFTVIIPGRLSSSRLPNKPIADILGIPMIVRVAMQAKKSGASRVICAVDDKKILDACHAYDCEAVLTDKNHSCGTDRICEAVNLCHIPDDEIIVNVQGDEPLIPPALITKVADLLLKDDDLQMGTAAIPIKVAKEFFNPNVVKVITDRFGKAITFSRAPVPWARDSFAETQSVLPPDFTGLRHVGIYSYRCGFLKSYPKLPASPLEEIEKLEQLRALWNGYKIGVEIFNEAIPPGVDTKEDLEHVRSFLSRTGNY